MDWFEENAPPKVFDPDAPDYNPYQPGTVVRHTTDYDPNTSGSAGIPGAGYNPVGAPQPAGTAAVTPPTTAPGGVPPGVTIPVTPGDPTHGGLFDSQGRYIGPSAAGATTGSTGTGGDVSRRLPGESTRDWVKRAALSIGRADIANDPGALSYWESAVNSKPQSDDMGYWLGKLQTPDHGGAGDSGGMGAGAGGNLGSMGNFLTPYGKTFVPPTGTDNEGFRFALDEGIHGIERGAAARGDLSTGGTIKDELRLGTGLALQDYAGAYSRAKQTFDSEYGIFKENQDRPFGKLFDVTQLGFNAANSLNNTGSSYANNLTQLGGNQANNLTNLANSYTNSNSAYTGNQGNINAGGTIGRNNNLVNGINTGINFFQAYRPLTAPGGY